MCVWYLLTMKGERERESCEAWYTVKKGCGEDREVVVVVVLLDARHFVKATCVIFPPYTHRHIRVGYGTAAAKTTKNVFCTVVVFKKRKKDPEARQVVFFLFT